MPQEFTPDISVFIKLNLNGFVMNRVRREGLTREGIAEKRLMQDRVSQGRLPRGRGSCFLRGPMSMACLEEHQPWYSGTQVLGQGLISNQEAPYSLVADMALVGFQAQFFY